MPMRTGRPKATLSLSSEQRMHLKALAASRTLPHNVVSRARLVLLADRLDPELANGLM